MKRIGVRQLAVVVPARNEELRIGACLTALQQAVTAVTASVERPSEVRIVVVLDRCTDDTARIVAGYDVERVVVDCGRVGGARAAGMEHALYRRRPERVWLACTDADSSVPADWLVTHWSHARAGADLLLGTVRPDPIELPPGTSDAWLARHDLTDGHPHVHGANLGVRGDVYRRAGGFPAVALHEDLVLAEAVRSGGGRVVATSSSPVLTSARRYGRTPGGLAGYLRELLGETA